jgi:hypothetical protein
LISTGAPSEGAVRGRNAPTLLPYILLKSYNVELEFSGEIWQWRGPAPYYFVTVPEEQCLDLQAVSAAVTYGWGMIPVRARIGDTERTTSLWPKDGRYVLPLKDVVRNAEGLEEGDTVTVRLTPGGPRRRA